MQTMLTVRALGLLPVVALAACATGGVGTPDAQAPSVPVSCGATALSASRVAAIEASVRALLQDIASDLAADGPEAWARHCLDSPTFTMASDGVLVFPTAEALRTFLTDFDASVATLSIEWSDVRIDPLGDALAHVGASYRERIVDTDGAEQVFGGYVTALATDRGDRWVLRHLHWSAPRGDAGDS